MLTGALLDVTALLERVAAQLAMEVVLPKLGKPDVAPVVVQRAAGEVAVEAWQGTRTSGPRTPLPHLPQPLLLPLPQTPGLEMAQAEGGRKGRAQPLIQGPAGKKQRGAFDFIQNEKGCIKSRGGGGMCHLTTAAFMGASVLHASPLNHPNANIGPL